MLQTLAAPTLLCVVFFGSNHQRAYAQTDGYTKDQLQQIEHVLNVVCGNYFEGGTSNKFAIDGKAKVELQNLLKKLAELGVEGAAKFDTDEYVGVLRAELAGERKSVRECRAKAWEGLQERFSPTKRRTDISPAPAARSPSPNAMTSSSPAHSLRAAELAFVTVDKLRVGIESIGGNEHSTTINVLITNTADKPAKLLLHRSNESKPRLTVIGGRTGNTELAEGLQWCRWSKSSSVNNG